jgi:hypothetical protein
MFVFLMQADYFASTAWFSSKEPGIKASTFPLC